MHRWKKKRRQQFNKKNDMLTKCKASKLFSLLEITHLRERYMLRHTLQVKYSEVFLFFFVYGGGRGRYSVIQLGKFSRECFKIPKKDKNTSLNW